MSKTLYGDAFIELKLSYVDGGGPDALHSIFDLAILNGAKPLKIMHPLNVFQRVLNGLDRDERFEKSYMNYCGFSTGLVRSFELKAPQR